MRFCIPAAGARIKLLNDWTVNTNDIVDHHTLLRVKTCPKQEKEFVNWESQKIMRTEVAEGPFTFPKGSILKILELRVFSQKKRNSTERVRVQIQKTSLEFLDKKPFKNIYFNINLNVCENFDFEYLI